MVFLSYLFIYFWQYRGLNSGPHTGRQVSYHLSHSTSPDISFLMAVYMKGFPEAITNLRTHHYWKELNNIKIIKN
jgi:hypothetical protein